MLYDRILSKMLSYNKAQLYIMFLMNSYNDIAIMLYDRILSKMLSYNKAQLYIMFFME